MTKAQQSERAQRLGRPAPRGEKVYRIEAYLGGCWRAYPDDDQPPLTESEAVLVRAVYLDTLKRMQLRVVEITEEETC